MEYLLALSWLGLCCLVGAIADSRGRNALAWGLGAFFFSPLLAWLALASLPVKVRL